MRLILGMLTALALSSPVQATDFKITITDTDVLAGIAWAREQYNASVPAESCIPNDKGERVCVAGPSPIATDEDYVRSRVLSLLENLAMQKAKVDGMTKVDADVAALIAKIEAARRK